MPRRALKIQPAFDPFDVFDRTVQIVTDNFYDRGFRGLPWADLIIKARAKLAEEMAPADFCAVVNGLLAKLKASHTGFFSNSDQDYWALKSIFSHDVDKGALWQPGASFKKIDGAWYVRNVFEMSAAAEGGLVEGDRVLEANGVAFSPIDSFRAGVEATLRIRSGPRAKSRLVRVRPRFESFQRSMLIASRASAKILDVKGRKIGYFHLWAGTHGEFKKALAACAASFLRRTDAFILDLRDGYGGAGPEYLKPFEKIYTKPLYALVNEGTRSGKEWIAHLLKESGRAKLVGARTAGFFLAGKPFEIVPDLFMLFLAVGGNGPQGVDLEGRGVTPQVRVASPLPYAQGRDPQLARALLMAARA